jgi:hypothetical protein
VPSGPGTMVVIRPCVLRIEKHEPLHESVVWFRINDLPNSGREVLVPAGYIPYLATEIRETNPKSLFVDMNDEISVQNIYDLLVTGMPTIETLELQNFNCLNQQFWKLLDRMNCPKLRKLVMTTNYLSFSDAEVRAIKAHLRTKDVKLVLNP